MDSVPTSSINLYYEDGRTVEYTPVAVKFQWERETGVVLITWNTPETMNAISPAMINESLFIMEYAKRTEGIKVLVWTGAGKAFSSGAQLKPGKKGAPKVVAPMEIIKYYKKIGMYWQVMNDIAMHTWTLAFWKYPKICVGAINGLAVGGATNIVLCNFFDFTIVSEDSKFKYPFTKLGITPELGSSRILPALIGYSKAKDLLMRGEWFYPRDVEKMGLVTEVCPAGEVIPKSLALARDLASKNIFSLQASKALVNGHLVEEMDRVLQLENKSIRQCILNGGPLSSAISKM